MGGSSRRTNRVSSLVQNELARLLLQEVSDPTLKGIVVTEVELSTDLKYAKVFFTKYSYGTEPVFALKEVLKGFDRATPFLRKKLGCNLDLRAVPELRFTEDMHNQEVNHLLGVFDSVSKNRIEDEKVVNT